MPGPYGGIRGNLGHPHVAGGPQSRGRGSGQQGGPRRAKPCPPRNEPGGGCGHEPNTAWQGQGERIQQFEPKFPEPWGLGSKPSRSRKTALRGGRAQSVPLGGGLGISALGMPSLNISARQTYGGSPWSRDPFSIHPRLCGRCLEGPPGLQILTYRPQPRLLPHAGAQGRALGRPIL